jgi:hypothetical protein
MRRLALLFLLVLAPPAAAVTPRSRAILENHKHWTHGHDWHVQLEVNKQSDRLASVVVYAQECEATGYALHLPVGPRGTFDIDRPLPEDGGHFTVRGRFTNADRAIGTWGVETTAGCAFGGSFDAQDATGHFLLGNPFEYAPKKLLGRSRYAKLLRGFQERVRLAARRFTPAYARAHGYEMSTSAGCPGLNHARKNGTAMWGPLLDPSQPQSLVYWCDAEQHWTLAGMMFRARGSSRPPTFDRMIQWHKHGATRTATWMTHVWLVRDPLAAFATCAPFNAFARAGMFTYHDYVAVPGDQPCKDTQGLD